MSIQRSYNIGSLSFTDSFKIIEKYVEPDPKAHYGTQLVLTHLYKPTGGATAVPQPGLCTAVQ